MKTFFTLIVGIIIGYGISGFVPMEQLKTRFVNMEIPDIAVGHELDIEAGNNTEAPKQ